MADGVVQAAKSTLSMGAGSIVKLVLGGAVLLILYFIAKALAEWAYSRGKTITANVKAAATGQAATTGASGGGDGGGWG